jgi:hypothetical protein
MDVSYIKQDGSPAVAVEWLNINMAGGELFGAVPTTMSESQETKMEPVQDHKLPEIWTSLRILYWPDLDYPG